MESHLGLLDSIVRNVERLCEGEVCCFGHRKKASALCLLYKVYHRVDCPMNEYLNHFMGARNTRVPASVGELASVIPRCRTAQFRRSFLPAAACLWNLLPLYLSRGDTLSSFKSTLN